MTKICFKYILVLFVLTAVSSMSARSLTLDEARAAAAKGNAAAQLELARVAFDNYLFSEALEALDKYVSKLGRNVEPAAEAASLRRRAELGMSMLDRVETVQVIDSLEVDADDFFKAFNLSAPSGSLVDGEIVERVLTDAWRDAHPDASVSSPVYVTESGDHILWSTEGGDKETSITMWEIDRLADGTWDEPRAIFDYTGIFDAEGGESVYSPYLMSDGMTIYFGAEGEASLGGLDIFISRRDEDGKFLQPQNLGMPYNSPADDYMMAIDELTGIGWWATDRAGKPGRVTIYRFIPTDLRVNYSPDTPGLPSLASLKAGVAATHPDGADYSSLLSLLPKGGEDEVAADDDMFIFPLAGKTIYTSLDDFKDNNARQMMEEYLDMQEEFNAMVEKVEELRAAYRGGDHSLGESILSHERDIERMRARLRAKANEVVKAEIGTAAN